MTYETRSGKLEIRIDPSTSNRKPLFGLGLAISALLFFGVAQGAFAAAGSSAANFLKIGTGARGAAMGDAQSAVTEDVNAAYWNPAGLANLRFKELSLQHYDLAEGIRYQNAAFGLPTEKGVFAFGLNVMNYGSIQGYDGSAAPTGDVDAKSTLISGSYARRVMEKSPLTVGGTFRYLQSDLAGYKASAPMFDLGVMFPFETERVRGLRVAAALRNVGPDIKYDKEGSPLPQQFVIGGGFSALGGNLVVALDAIKPKDSDSYFATGLDYRVFQMLHLRAGYNGVSDFVGNGLTYGIGLQFTQWNVDYAIVPFGDFGGTNRISVGVRFGNALQTQRADEQVERAYQTAQRQLALGNGVEAYSTLNEVLLIAPWHKPSVELKAKIEKQFEQMAVSKSRARLEAEIADAFTKAKTAFDHDELVEAKKGFDTILLLQPEHVGAKVYLERIENRYASLAQESFKQGMGFYAAGDYPKAKLAFEKTLTIDANHADARAQLAKTIAVMQDSTQREKERGLLAEAAESYRAGLAMYQKNDLEGALTKFEEVKLLAPDFEEVTRYLDLTKKTLAGVLFEEADVNSNNGQYDEAVKKLRRANELSPEDTRLPAALALAERNLDTKNAEQSRELYKQGLEAYLQGQTDKAQQLWRKAIELDSSNEEAIKAISKIEEQKKNEIPNQGR